MNICISNPHLKLARPSCWLGKVSSSIFFIHTVVKWYNKSVTDTRADHRNCSTNGIQLTRFLTVKERIGKDFRQIQSHPRSPKITRSRESWYSRCHTNQHGTPVDEVFLPSDATSYPDQMSSQSCRSTSLLWNKRNFIFLFLYNFIAINQI